MARNSPEAQASGGAGAPALSRAQILGMAAMAIAVFVIGNDFTALSVALPAIEKDLGRSFSLTAAQAKLKTGRLAVRCAEEAVQIHGGYGYIEEYPVCRFYRDAKILTIGEGTDEVQQMVIARALGA